MEIVFMPSAAKHGYTKADALNAITNPGWKKTGFNPPRNNTGHRPDAVIGFATNGDEIEVFYSVEPTRVVIFHCMHARPAIRQLLNEVKE